MKAVDPGDGTGAVNRVDGPGYGLKLADFYLTLCHDPREVSQAQ